MPPIATSDSGIALRADSATRELLDVNDGIERVMGDRALYARMLMRFRADYRSGAQPIRRALDGADVELAHRCAHTLVGTSGMIGAHQLHHCACDLEKAIRTRSGREGAELQRLDSALRQVLAVCDAMIAGYPDEAVRAAPDLLDDTGLLAQLIALLSAGDGAAVDVIAQSGASLRVMLGEERYARVAAKAQAFEFAQALAALHVKG